MLQGPRVFIRSKAICAAPPCEVLTPCRGRGPHHVQKERIGTRGPAVKSVGKPDAGDPHVRFDERGRETGRCRMAQATAPSLDSTILPPRLADGSLTQEAVALQTLQASRKPSGALRLPVVSWASSLL